jgi:hypothetical protein
MQNAEAKYGVKIHGSLVSRRSMADKQIAGCFLLKISSSFLTGNNVRERP